MFDLVFLGYIILLAGSILGLPSWLAFLPNLLLLKVLKSNINIGLIYVSSFFVVYNFIDLVWYYFYDYHIPFLAFLGIILLNLYSQTDSKLDDNGLFMAQAETFTVGLFGLYTLVFVEFNWV